MHRLMLDHLKGFVTILNGDVAAIYESVNFFESESYR